LQLSFLVIGDRFFLAMTLAMLVSSANQLHMCRWLAHSVFDLVCIGWCFIPTPLARFAAYMTPPFRYNHVSDREPPMSQNLPEITNYAGHLTRSINSAFVGVMYLALAVVMIFSADRRLWLPNYRSTRNKAYNFNVGQSN